MELEDVQLPYMGGEGVRYGWEAETEVWSGGSWSPINDLAGSVVVVHLAGPGPLSVNARIPWGDVWQTPSYVAGGPTVVVRGTVNTVSNTRVADGILFARVRIDGVELVAYDDDWMENPLPYTFPDESFEIWRPLLWT